MTNKGDYNGECNRTACSKGSAVYYNHSTRKYYCEKCALLINEYNYADAHRIYGHDLCTLGEQVSECVDTVDPRLTSLFILTNQYNQAYDISYPRAKPLKHSGHYTTVRTNPKIGRNSFCLCGSSKKYKNCCLQ